ncbi:hypothetical protein [Hoeflea alexandrii]|uniref:Uncharacterized protein n=1 Tax=Hoeflea alexandrii TaxID=288436 RepID=A0ABT1CV26_9HYPH|nr:hypothetical protein [Hoeflea alexandrii]MCO6410064.1 hypothetical protein [Hoeflea alexandrii]MCY0153036.1 hypothetical protein [Hoeflea alexandrii]
MKLDDIETIRELAATREKNLAVLARLKETSPRLVLGIGTDAIEIRMPPTLQQLVNESVTDSLTDQIAQADENLRTLGVDI